MKNPRGVANITCRDLFNQVSTEKKWIFSERRIEKKMWRRDWFFESIFIRKSAKTTESTKKRSGLFFCTASLKKKKVGTALFFVNARFVDIRCALFDCVAQASQTHNALTFLPKKCVRESHRLKNKFFFGGPFLAGHATWVTAPISIWRQVKTWHPATSRKHSTEPSRLQTKSVREVQFLYGAWGERKSELPRLHTKLLW